jgi:hypothetical protein
MVQDTDSSDDARKSQSPRDLDSSSRDPIKMKS